MHRRALLRALPLAAIGSSAGCASVANPGASTRTPTEPPSCPSWDGVETVCYTALDDPPTDPYLEPTRRDVERPVGELEFHVVNPTEETYTVFVSIDTWKHVGGRWVNPILPGESLVPGGSGATRDVSPGTRLRRGYSPTLAPGQFAFLTSTRDPRLVLASTVRVTGPPLPVDPTDVERTERENGAVYVYTTTDGTGLRGAHLRLDVVDDPDETYVVPTETVARVSALRNGLPSLRESGVRTVHVGAEWIHSPDENPTDTVKRVVRALYEQYGDVPYNPRSVPEEPNTNAALAYDGIEFRVTAVEE